jgi:hypothetical protein
MVTKFEKKLNPFIKNVERRVKWSLFAQVVISSLQRVPLSPDTNFKLLLSLGAYIAQ